MSARLLHGECLALMREMPDNSVDLIATDPPYFKVKGEAWDHQWDTPIAFLAWLDSLAEQWQRILRPNGSLYVFAWPKMAARVEILLGERFNVLQRVTWAKPAYSTKAEMNAKEDQRVFFPVSEAILFAEQKGADSMARGESGYAAMCEELRGQVFEPLRAYLDGERRRAGADKVACNVACGFSASPGGMAARHYFSRSQWWLPTEEHYTALQRLFGPGYLERPYNELRAEYEELRQQYEELRRPFSVTADVPYTDVWTFPTVSTRKGKHPCEKPLAMMEHIVRTSSRPGGVVLDCFMGSGVTGEAALNLGRDFIGMELDDRYFEMAQRRIEGKAA